MFLRRPWANKNMKINQKQPQHSGVGYLSCALKSIQTQFLYDLRSIHQQVLYNILKSKIYILLSLGTCILKSVNFPRWYSNTWITICTINMVSFLGESYTDENIVGQQSCPLQLMLSWHSNWTAKSTIKILLPRQAFKLHFRAFRENFAFLW